MAQTARISNRSDTIINEMAVSTGRSKVEIIERALESYRREERMRQFNKGYHNLQFDVEAWEEELRERAGLEGTLGDGLEEE